MKDMKKNMKNEKAVSAVIGVILMVVVTVIIAAILAVFVFGIGSPAKAPEAKLKFTAIYNSSALPANPYDFKVTHSGGDPIILKDEQLIVKYAINDTMGVNVGARLADGTLTMKDYFPPYTTLSPGFTITSNMSGAIRGDILIVQVMDVPTGQMVSDLKITVQ